jgi:hypothetical protein
MGRSHNPFVSVRWGASATAAATTDTTTAATTAAMARMLPTNAVSPKHG